MSVLYHCDPALMFRSEKAAKNHHEPARIRAQRQALKSTLRLSADDVSLGTMKARCMVDHLSALIVPGQIISSPRSALEIESSDATLVEPAFKRHRTVGRDEDVNPEDSVCAGLDTDEIELDFEVCQCRQLPLASF